MESAISKIHKELNMNKELCLVDLDTKEEGSKRRGNYVMARQKILKDTGQKFGMIKNFNGIT